MTLQMQTLHMLRRTGRSHLAVAMHAASIKPAAGDHAVVQHTPAYLAHVAMECALKAHLLYRSGCASKEELEKKHPKVHAEMFRGKQAHDLQRVADQVRLPDLMARHGKAWHADDCWKRLTDSERPYSLRYGYAELDAKALSEELERASEIVATVLGASSPRNAPLSGRQRKPKRK